MNGFRESRYQNFDMDILCSFLIPSRARPEKCAKAIESILVDPRSEVAVRIDDDDPYIDRYKSLICYDRTTLIIGPRIGYDGGSRMVSEMSDKTNSPWIVGWNDDMTIEGTSFSEKLSHVPTTGYIVHPSVHRLGASTYQRDPTGPAPIIPNQCWHLFGFDSLPHPCDTWAHHFLVLEKGWQTWWLGGMAVNHDRDAEHLIAAHRKM